VLALNNDECIGAESPVSVIRPISAFPRAIWSDFELEPWQREGIAKWGRGHLGTPYNFIDDLAIGLERVLREHTPKLIIRRLSSSQHLECAQLCDAAYWYGGAIQLYEDHRYFAAVAPSDYTEMFQDGGWWPEGLPTTYRSRKAQRLLKKFEHVTI
jgi:hypothetical protein